MSGIYAATPLEQAYGLYLAQHVFGVPVPLPSDNNNNNNSNAILLTISGRDAVPFLTRSGVDRGILRSIWSVADPSNIGSLTSIRQFHVVLRLVSMAQAGLLSNHQQHQHQLAPSLQQHSSLSLALPVFSSVVVPPSDQLMGSYGHLLVQTNVPAATPNPQMMGSMATTPPDASVDADADAAGTLTAPPALQSVGDAFGTLVEVRDAPLMGLESISSSSNNDGNQQSVGEAFGGIVGVQDSPLRGLGSGAAADPPTTTAGSSLPNAAAGMPTNAFAGMGPAANDVPLPAPGGSGVTRSAAVDVGVPPSTPGGRSFSAGATRQPPPGQTDGGGGGGFGFWSLSGASAVGGTANRFGGTVIAPGKISTASPGASFTAGAALPSPAAQTAPVSFDDNDDEFGDFGSAAPPPPVQRRPFVTDFGRALSEPIGSSSGGGGAPPGLVPASMSTTVSVSDAFGDMVPSRDAPLPSLDAFAGGEGGTPADADPPAKAVDDDDDGFGTFETAAAAMPVPETTGNESNDLFGFRRQPGPPASTFLDNDDNGNQFRQPNGFSAAKTGPAAVAGFSPPRTTSVADSGPSLSIADSFGGMPAPQDAPLPSLESMTRTNAATAPLGADEFAIGAVGNAQDDDAFGTFEGAETATATIPEPVAPQTDAGDEDGDSDDDFGDFGGATAAEGSRPAPVGGADLLGFDAGAATTTAPGTVPEPAAASGAMMIAGHVRSVSIDDAFGDLSAPENDPLPPLQMMAAGGDPATRPGPAPGDGGPSDPTKESDDDDFGMFSGPESLAQGGSGVPGVDDSHDDDDKFGDFGTAPAQQLTEPSHQSDLLGFGPVGGVTDLTAGAPVVPSSSADSAPMSGSVPSMSVSDAFSGMSGNDAALPSLDMLTAQTELAGDNRGATSGENDDGFGSFETPPSAQIEAAGGSGFATTQSGASESVATDNEKPTNASDGNLTGLDGFAVSAPASLVPPLPTSAEGISVSDAFGNFEVADAPLPSLNPIESSRNEALPSVPQGVGNMFGNATSNDESLLDFHESSPTPNPMKNDGGDLLDIFGAEPRVSTDHVPSSDEEDEFGDFGGVETRKAPDDAELAGDDEFGDFGAAEPATTAADTQAPVAQPTIQDGFGDFGTAAIAVPSQDSVDKTPPIAEDIFGSFETSEIPPPVNASLPQPQSIVENDFGDFGSAQNTPPTNIDPAQSITDDDFGVFGSAVTPPPTHTNTAQSTTDDDFGCFGSDAIAPPAEANPGQSMTEDDFGDFGSSTITVPASTDPAQSTAEDDFGDFGSAEIAHSITNTHPVQPTTEDDFGDFGSAEIAPPAKANPGHAMTDDDFGDFGSAQIAPPNQVNPAQSTTENGFGDFGSATVTPPVSTDPAQSTTDDDFGNFGSAVTTAPAENNTDPAQSMMDEDFGDFGSAEITPPADDDADALQSAGDDFGEFGSAETTTPAENAANAAQPTDDDFGYFGSAEIASPLENTAGAAQSTDDDFGDFGSAKIASPAENNTDTAESTDDDFGDFGSAEMTSSSENNATSAQIIDDDFGDFGSADDMPPIKQTTDDFGEFASGGNVTVAENNKERRKQEEDLFGNFGSAEDTTQGKKSNEIPGSGGVEEFGDFGSANLTTAIENPSQKVPSEDEDDFGDFGTAEFPETAAQNGDIAKSGGDTEFGDFADADAPQNNDVGVDDDFGDFGSFQEPSPPIEQSHETSKPAESKSNDDTDEFGDFENVGTPSMESETEEITLRNRIRSLALQLPDCVLRQAGVSGDHVDLGESFEINIGIRTSMTQKSRRRAKRCIQVLESLTSAGNSKLASTFWKQVFDVVRDELELAKSLLIEASTYSKDDWSELHAPLSVMVRGLSEYMRVTRSIVASIGDVLLLDESAMLTVDTWASTWCSLSVLEKALECEKKWKEIQNQLIKTPLDVVEMATVEEIRSNAGSPVVAKFCHLTLRPLLSKNKGTTKGEVSFQGKRFMACSANFLANRCPSIVVGQEV